ncbi:endonuclease/exonuclease/phosphatase family protein [Paenibacillus cremeus]|nr:endonuclease/exonuclease/phosphatase family protein [Paenibacillus cremeus]
MTLMTFNLRYNTPNDGDNIWTNRRDGAAQLIQEHAPLVVGTQEGYHVMLTDLQERLEAYSWIGQGRMGGLENEHCAIFYRHAELVVVDQGQFWLSETPQEPATKSWDSNLPRICTWARFACREGRGEFFVYNTHLDHIGQQAREYGAMMIWDLLNRHRSEFNLPAIVMGDLNSRPDENPIRFLRGEIEAAGRKTWLKDAYTALSGPIGYTAHEFKGLVDGEPIDYIFVTPEVDVLETVVERRMIAGRYPSDHYPVISKIQLNEER